MRRILSTLAVLILAAGAGAADFGRMFPDDKPTFQPPDAALTSLSLTQQDPNLDADNNPDLVPSFWTYYGQAGVDHDAVLNVGPLNEANDVEVVVNGRTAAFDLDVVYCGGPAARPDLYNPDDSLKLTTRLDGVVDVPRDESGRAIICDQRNDENLVAIQIQLLFMKYHNMLIQQKGLSFEQAQLRLSRLHQWIIVHEFLPEVVGQAIVDKFLWYNGADKPKYKRGFYRPGDKNDPTVPIEWSVAAYRIGHTWVRLAYTTKSPAPGEAPVRLQVFNAAGNDLHGGRPIPASNVIDWENFLDLPGIPRPPLPQFNVGRKNDELVSRSLFNLRAGQVFPLTDTPIVISLPERNLLRGKRLALPTYQAVARRMGLTTYTNAELGITDPEMGDEAPLWYGILAASRIETGGRRMGQLGGEIVADVILGLIDADENSYLNVKGQRWRPNARNSFTAADLITLND